MTVLSFANTFAIFGILAFWFSGLLFVLVIFGFLDLSWSLCSVVLFWFSIVWVLCVG